MSIRTKWLGAIVSLAVVASVVDAGYATVQAASGKRVAQKARSGVPSVRCKKNITPKGVVKWSDWQFPSTLNGYQQNAAIGALNANFIFDGLFTYNSKAAITPKMLTKYPSFRNGGLQQGGKVVNLTIKKGLRWSNGAEITAKDLLFGWEVDNEKATGPLCQDVCDKSIISKFQVTSRYSVRITLKRPVGPLVYTLGFDIWPSKWRSSSGSWSSPAQAAQLLALTKTYNFEDKTYPTNGPYQVAEYTKDNRIVYTPMKYYSDSSCGGALKKVYFVFYADKAAMIAGAANRETDMTEDYTSFDIPSLTKYSRKFKTYVDPAFFQEHMEFNLDPTYNGKPNPLSKVKVRLALTLALDKIGLVRSALAVNKATAKGLTAYTPLVITKSLVQPFADKSITGQWDPIKKKYVVPGTSAALSDARTLLRQAGYGSGFTIDVFTTSGNPVRANEVAVITNNWKRVGVTVNPNFIPAGTFFSDYTSGSQLNRGTFQVAIFAFIGSPDPDQLKYNLVSSFIDRAQAVHNTINANYAGVRNKAIDRAFKIEFSNPNKKVRAAAFKVIQQQLSRNAYWDPLYYRTSIATSDGKIVNFTNNPTQAGQTWNSYDWRVKTG